METAKRTVRAASAARREREKESHRQEIIAVAEAVFSAHGFDGTTVEMVAREAGFSVGGIYNFFQGKEDLFRQVFLAVSTRRTERVHEAVAPLLGKPWEALRALVKVWTDYYVEHREFLRTAFSAVTAGGSSDRPRSAPPPEFLACFRDYYREVGTVFAALQGAPDARPFKPEESLAIAQGVVREWLTRAGRDPVNGAPCPIPEGAAEEVYGTLYRIFRKDWP